MGDTPRILAFAGSARAESFNKKLLRAAVRGVEAAGMGCTAIDLRDYPLPLYDGDLEDANGLPEHAVALRRLFAEHRGLLIASPEYNSSISAVLKNTIDWVTRSPERTPDLSGFQGRVAGLLSASPGPLGGMRGLVVLRLLLGNIGVTVLPDQIALRAAHQAFDADGELVDPAQKERAESLGARLAAVVAALHR